LSVSTDDFKRAALEAVKSELREGLWPVWIKYELVPCEAPATARYIHAPSVFRPDDLRWSTEPVELEWNGLVSIYRPLVDTPELFLEFSRLADDKGLDAELGSDKNAEVALGWAQVYGVLGLTPTKGQGLYKPAFDLFHGGGERLSAIDPRDPERPEVVVADGTVERVLKIAHITTQQTHGQRRDVQGGQNDTVEAFALEAWTAHTALRLYEAANADAGPKMDTIRHYWRSMASFSGSMPPASPEESKTWAEEWVVNAMLSRTRGYVYPQPYRADRGFVQGMRFESLLDAIWLQMLWLLTAGNNVRKCRYFDCDKVITFKASDQQTKLEDPGMRKSGRRKYKPRVDKEFCSLNCKSKNHYHKKMRHSADSI
jgi:hypothetical protein